MATDTGKTFFDTAPKRLHIFYGIPEIYRGMGNLEEIARTLAAHYDVVVFGDGLSRIDSPFRANTKTIIWLLNKHGVRVYGYVSLAAPWRLATPGDLTALKSDVDQWKDIGASGIFLDEAGFDYNVPRTGQNEVLSYIKDRNMYACMNAWQIQDVVCANVSETGWTEADAEYHNFVAMNPNNTPTVATGKFVSYLFESFAVSEAGLIPFTEFVKKAEAVVQFNTLGLEVFAVARINGVNVPGGVFVPDVSNTRMTINGLVDYVCSAAIIFSIDALGFSDSGFGSDTSYPLTWTVSNFYINTRLNKDEKFKKANTFLTKVNGVLSEVDQVYTYQRSTSSGTIELIKTESGVSVRFLKNETEYDVLIPHGVDGLLHYDKIPRLTQGEVLSDCLGLVPIPVFKTNDSRGYRLAYSPKDMDIYTIGEYQYATTIPVTLTGSASIARFSIGSNITFGYMRLTAPINSTNIYLATDSNKPVWKSISRYTHFDYSCDFALGALNKASSVRIEIGLASTGTVNLGLDSQAYGSIWLKVVSNSFVMCMKGVSTVRTIATNMNAGVAEYNLNIVSDKFSGLVYMCLTNKTSGTRVTGVFDLVNDTELIPPNTASYLWPVFGIANIAGANTSIAIDLAKISVASKL